jgi:hypothetical protein
MIDTTGEEMNLNHSDRVQFTTTNIRYDQPEGILTIGAAVPPSPAIPSHRKWLVRLISHNPLPDTISCTVGNKPQGVTVEAVENGTLITFGPIPTRHTVKLYIGSVPQIDVQDALKRCWTILFNANYNYNFKQTIWFIINEKIPLNERVDKLKKMDLTSELLGPLSETLLADKRYANVASRPAQ